MGALLLADENPADQQEYLMKCTYYRGIMSFCFREPVQDGLCKVHLARLENKKGVEGQSSTTE